MISDALRLIRVFRDVKQNELAERLGISRSYLSEIESGKRVPRIDLIEKYAEEFEVSASSIVVFSEDFQEGSERLALLDMA